MDFNILMYIFFGIVSIAGAIILLIAKHPIRGAMGLLTTMLALAAMYAQLHAHSIAVFQVIIYAGAVMVLIVYFIMLLDIKSEDYAKPFSKFFWLGAPILFLVIIFFIFKLSAIIKSDGAFISILNSDFSSADIPNIYGGIKIFSKELLTKYLFAFEFVSTLLFAAIVAVIAIVQLDWKGKK